MTFTEEPLFLEGRRGGFNISSENVKDREAGLGAESKLPGGVRPRQDSFPWTISGKCLRKHSRYVHVCTCAHKYPGMDPL